MAQTTYDILIYDLPGHPHFVDGGVIIIKPEDSFWSQEELALGNLKKLKFKDGEYEAVSLDILNYAVDNKNNPQNISKVR